MARDSQRSNIDLYEELWALFKRSKFRRSDSGPSHRLPECLPRSLMFVLSALKHCNFDTTWGKLPEHVLFGHEIHPAWMIAFLCKRVLQLRPVKWS